MSAIPGFANAEYQYENATAVNGLGSMPTPEQRAADELQTAGEMLTALTERLRGLFEDEQPCFTDGEVRQVDVCGVLMCKGGLRIDFELDLDGDLQDALRGLARQLRAVAEACD